MLSGGAPAQFFYQRFDSLIYIALEECEIFPFLFDTVFPINKYKPNILADHFNNIGEREHSKRSSHYNDQVSLFQALKAGGKYRWKTLPEEHDVRLDKSLTAAPEHLLCLYCSIEFLDWVLLFAAYAVAGPEMAMGLDQFLDGKTGI